MQHLFHVVCGLDSMVVGEAQILGQVRDALRLAQQEGAVGRALNELGQQALRVGKRAHAETGIDRAGSALMTAGLDLATATLGDLTGRRALVVGAGSLSALAVASLQRAGLGDVVVLNRDVERASALAASVGGGYGDLSALGDELAAADVVVSCTGATGGGARPRPGRERRWRPAAAVRSSSSTSPCRTTWTRRPPTSTA